MQSPDVVDCKMDRGSVLQRAVKVTGGTLLILSALTFASCKDSDDVGTTPKNTPATAPSPVSTASSAPSKGLIKADPNPVPTGPGELGKTRISWNNPGEALAVSIFVSTNGEPEVSFAQGDKEGSAEAPWIQSGPTYDFRMYAGAGANKRLIDHVTVTRNK